MATDVEKIVVKLIGEGSSYERMLKKATASTVAAERKFKSLNTQIQKTSKSMVSMGRKMSFRVTAPLLALGVAAIKVGSDFQSGFAGVEKTVDATQAELAVLKEGFKDLAGDIPVAVEELLGIGEIAGQLGIANDQILDFTKTISMLGVTTNLSTEEAATSLARFSNITGLSQDKISNLGSTIVALGNSLATSERDIVSMATRLAGAGTTIGLSEDQILAMAGALSSVGLEAEAGGSAFSKLFLQMGEAVATNSDELSKFAEISGKSINEFKELFRTDAAGAVQSLLGGLNKLGAEDKIIAIKDLGVESIRMTDAILRSSGAVDLLATSLDAAKIAFDENTALTKEADVRFKSFASQIQLLKNQVKLLLTDAFDVMEPTLRKIIDSVKIAVKWFKNLSLAAKRVAIIIALVTATIGPLLIAGGFLVGVFGSIITTFGLFIVEAAAVVAAVVAVGFAFVKTFDIDLKATLKLALAHLINFGKNVYGFLQNWNVNWKLAIDWLRENWWNLIKDLGQIFVSYVKMYIHNAEVMVDTTVKLWWWFGGVMEGVWKKIFKIDYIKWIKAGFKAAAILVRNDARFIHSIRQQIRWGGDPTEEIDAYISEMDKIREAGIDLDWGKSLEISQDGLNELQVNPLKDFESATTPLPDFLGVETLSERLDVEKAGKELGEEIARGLADELKFAKWKQTDFDEFWGEVGGVGKAEKAGQELADGIARGLADELEFAKWKQEDFDLLPWVEDLDPVVIDVIFNVIDAAEYGGAEALSRIDEYLALRGTRNITDPFADDPMGAGKWIQEGGGGWDLRNIALPPVQGALEAMTMAEQNRTSTSWNPDQEIHERLFQRIPEEDWLPRIEPEPETQEIQEGILEGIETLVEQGKAEQDANLRE